MIQLGFLKLLKGTQMYDEVEKYQYKYYSRPPYEVFSNKFISFGELVKLKNLEKMLDYYYNSEKFRYTCDFVINNNFDTPFAFFEKIAGYYDKKGYLKISHKEVALFNILYDFYVENNLKDLDIFVEFLKYDYLALGKPGSYPEWLKSNKDSELHNQLIKDSEFKSVREGHKNSELEEFKYNIFTNKRENINIFFNYKTKKHEIIFK